MEFEDVSEEMKWEARRMAAAFGVKTSVVGGLEGVAGTVPVALTLEKESARLVSVEVGSAKEHCIFCKTDLLHPLLRLPEFNYWISPHERFNELMARGLYRLGIADEEMLADLGVSFTAHEELELRLSLPREFWPKKWLDEEEE